MREASINVIFRLQDLVKSLAELWQWLLSGPQPKPVRIPVENHQPSQKPGKK
jgi:hypothetical protein